MEPYMPNAAKQLKLQLNSSDNIRVLEPDFTCLLTPDHKLGNVSVFNLNINIFLIYISFFLQNTKKKIIFINMLFNLVNIVNKKNYTFI